MAKVITQSGTGYRSQFDRARRFLDRVQSLEPRRDVDYQDDVWAFFQNCWHVIDWLGHDRLVPRALREQIISEVLVSKMLRVCRDMANGTKHRKLTRRGKKAPPRPRAVHLYTSTSIVPGGPTLIDCWIKFPRRKVQLRSAREVATHCLLEWERILNAHGLRTNRLS
jgi:hypothetical protein